MLKWIIASSSCAIVSFGVPALAQSNSDPCFAAQTDSDVRIEDCTKWIKSGRLEPENLSIAYYNRGFAYADNFEEDRAIADFDSAIQANPENAAAFYSRGIRYAHKGEHDRALADESHAIQLN